MRPINSTALFAVILTSAPVLGQTAETLVVPLYYGSTADQANVGSAYPAAGAIIMDFNVGCGANAYNSTYASQVVNAHNNHLMVYGYVYSAAGCGNYSNGAWTGGYPNPDCPTTAGTCDVYTHDATSMETYIRQWYDWYGIDGIFFDVGSKYAQAQPFYSTLHSYVHSYAPSQAKATVVLNAPGYQQYQGILSVTDVLVAREMTCNEYFTSYSEPSWFTSASSSQTMMIATSCDQTQLAAVLQAFGDSTHHAGYVYVTNKSLTDTNPATYQVLPPYWSAATTSTAPREFSLVNGTSHGFATLNPPPGPIQTTQSGSAQFAVAWNALNDYASPISLTVQASGPHVTCTPTTLGLNQSATCTCAGNGANPGNYSVTLTPGLTDGWAPYPQASTTVTCSVVQDPPTGTFARTYGNMQGSTGSYVVIQNSGSGTITNIGGQCNDYGSRITSGLVSSLAPGASMTVQASLGSSYHCGFQFWGTNASNSPYIDPTF